MRDLSFELKSQLIELFIVMVSMHFGQYFHLTSLQFTALYVGVNAQTFKVDSHVANCCWCFYSRPVSSCVSLDVTRYTFVRLYTTCHCMLSIHALTVSMLLATNKYRCVLYMHIS